MDASWQLLPWRFRSATWKSLHIMPTFPSLLLHNSRTKLKISIFNSWQIDPFYKGESIMEAKLAERAKNEGGGYGSRRDLPGEPRQRQRQPPAGAGQGSKALPNVGDGCKRWKAAEDTAGGIMSAKWLQPKGVRTKRGLCWTQWQKSHLLQWHQRFTHCSSSVRSQLLWAVLERSNAATQEICWVAPGSWRCNNSHHFGFLHTSLLLAAPWLFYQALSPFLLQTTQLRLSS